MTEECKKEITEYVDSKGFKLDVTLCEFYNINNPPKGYELIYNHRINRGYYMDSKEGIKRNIENMDYGGQGWINLDTYFLEFIGHILKKHNIKIIQFAASGTYESTNWKFEKYKKSLVKGLTFKNKLLKLTVTLIIKNYIL